MHDSRKTRARLESELRALREQVAASTPLPPPGTPGPTPEDSDERYRHVLENLRAIMVETNERGENVYVSPTVSQVLGYQPEELLGTRGTDWVHGDDLDALVDLTRNLRETGHPTRAVYRARHKSGHWVWLETSSATTYRTAAGAVHTVTFSRDVTDVRLATEALRASEDRFRAMAESASDLISELDESGRIMFVSPNCNRLLGRPAEELVGRSLEDEALLAWIHPDDRTRMQRGARRVAAGGGGHIEFRMQHVDGSWRSFDSQSSTYRSPDGSVRTVAISRDVTERKRAERELRESEARYAVITATTHEIISEVDAEGRLRFASPAIETVLGFRPDELLGTNVFDLVHPADRERVVGGFGKDLEDHRPIYTRPYRVRRKDGSWCWLESAGIAYERADGERLLLSLNRDITERTEAEQERAALEERMQQAQKLEGLGVMAGGIAHDFNNLLTPILGDASLALMDLPESSAVRVRLQKIQKAAQRAASLTNQMLAYAGKGPLLVEPLDLSALVREMAQLLETSTSREAVLAYELADDPPAVKADGAQLSQVVMNLITNASEAVGDGGGHITICTGTAEMDREALGRMILGPDLPGGVYVYVEIRDTGSGMDAETRARIFDPFFTTKFTGRGLGLAAVLGIVRGHRGAIEIESQPGEGTRFRVLFPSAGLDLPPPVPEPSFDQDWRSEATVLVVDDDDGVREHTAETLERTGMTVLSAADGDQALRIFEARSEQIDVIVLDRTMPAESGEETFHALRRIKPAARIILVSGYSQERAAERFVGKGLAGFLQKPFLPANLLQKIRAALED